MILVVAVYHCGRTRTTTTETTPTMTGNPKTMRFWRISMSKKSSTGESGSVCTAEVAGSVTLRSPSRDALVVLDDGQRCRAKPELIEDLRPVPQVLCPGCASQIFRDHDRVARHQVHPVERAEDKAAAALADDGAVRSQHIHASLIGLLPRASCLRQVVGKAL